MRNGIARSVTKQSWTLRAVTKQLMLKVSMKHSEDADKGIGQDRVFGALQTNF